MTLKSALTAVAVCYALTSAAGAFAATTPIVPLGNGNGAERCLIPGSGNCPAGGDYGGKASILSIISDDLNDSLVRVDDAFDQFWANLVKDGGIVRARARYAGDNSELGYTLTDKTGYVKLLGVIGNKKVMVDDPTLPGVYGTDVVAVGSPGWVTIVADAGDPYQIVLNDLTKGTFLSSAPGSATFDNSFDQMVTWKVVGSKDPHYIIAWEDRVITQQFDPKTGEFKCKGANCDYNDYVFELKLTQPVPEPSTYALMGVGLLGIGAALRKRAGRGKRLG
jgi:hypothetical protein